MFRMIVPAEKLHFYRLCGTSMYSKVLGLYSVPFLTLNWLAGNKLFNSWQDFPCHPIPPESELYFASVPTTSSLWQSFLIRTQWYYSSKNLPIFNLFNLLCLACFFCFHNLISLLRWLRRPLPQLDWRTVVWGRSSYKVLSHNQCCGSGSGAFLIGIPDG